MINKYADFLARKTPLAMASGFDPKSLPDHLFDFQQACVSFCIKQGRAGLYLDTGLGKTRCQLEWAAQSAHASNGRALILTPLAVAKQMEREALALGYEARVIREQADAGPGINICNYDRIEKLDADDFGAVSLDESSILKSFGGKEWDDAFGGLKPFIHQLANHGPDMRDALIGQVEPDFTGNQLGDVFLLHAHTPRHNLLR
jgi:hypothetical protein